MGKTLKQEKLESIIEAAKRMFARYGQRKTSMDELAQVARVAKATIYSHFGTKDKVYQEVLYSEINEIVEKISAAVAKESSPMNKLTAFVKTKFNQRRKALNILNLNREGIEKVSPLAGEIRNQLFEREVNIISSILKEGVDEGIFHINNIILTAKAICHALRGFELTWLVEENEERIDNYHDELIRILFYGLIGGKENIK